MTDQTTQAVPATADADIETSAAVALLAGAGRVAAPVSATPPPASSEANEEDPGVRDKQIAELAAMIMALFPGETDPFNLGWGKTAPTPPALEWFADMPFDDRLQQLACADV